MQIALMRAMFEKWRSGPINSRLQIIQAARDGDENCHAALCELLIEFASARELPPLELLGYQQEVLLQSMTRAPKLNASR